MERIVPKLLIWEQISEHFSTQSFFAPKWRCPLWMKQTIGRAETCLGKFGCMSLLSDNSTIVMRAGKWGHALENRSIYAVRLLVIDSLVMVLQEIVLAQSSSRKEFQWQTQFKIKQVRLQDMPEIYFPHFHYRVTLVKYSRYGWLEVVAVARKNARLNK